MKEIYASIPPEHEHILLQVISERIGAEASRPLFTETLLELLEDVSGFETLGPSERRRLTKYFWEMYKRGSSQNTELHDGENF